MPFNPSKLKVSFNGLSPEMPKDPNFEFLALIEETEKSGINKKSFLRTDTKRRVFGYYHRLFTHYSISYGT